MIVTIALGIILAWFLLIALAGICETWRDWTTPTRREPPRVYETTDEDEEALAKWDSEFRRDR